MEYNMVYLNVHKAIMKYIRDIVITIVSSIVIFLILQTTIGAVRVYETSSVPNIMPGDYIIVDKVSYVITKPQRGEMIILHSPVEENKDLIKRIIAIPGDTIEVRDNQVFVNNIPAKEPYLKEPTKYDYPKESIPEGFYFVLGDNRNVAAGSQNGWLLPRANIVGKAWIIYWPAQRMGLVKHYKII
jgi:signal peptidase I